LLWALPVKVLANFTQPTVVSASIMVEWHQQMEDFLSKDKEYLMGFAITLTKSFSDAEDLFQIVCLKLLENPRILSVPERERRAIATVAMKNAHTDNFRFQRRYARTLQAFAEQLYISENKYQEITTLEVRDLIRECVRLLEKNARSVVEMYLLEVPHQEIAERLGITEANSRKIFSRAKSNLRICIDGKMGL
jgi:RNA polymerase sigma factor (sigma-70 family)